MQLLKPCEDSLGEVIVVGDVVVYATGSYADTGIDMVTKINPVTIKVGGSDKSSNNTVVITEMYKRDHKEAYHQLLERRQKHFCYDKPKAKKPKVRYIIQLSDVDGEPCLVCKRLVDGVSGNELNIKKCYLTVARFRSKPFSDKVYWSSPKIREHNFHPSGMCWKSYSHDDDVMLTSAMVKKLIGYAPLNSEIIAYNVTENECLQMWGDDLIMQGKNPPWELKR